ncbi:hypothetical protein E2562_004257 [Oryza meyeriana var. granulata]|uniref:Uncharacterized protein n=1 Tax=Oryza meyeriana var. granulata TaxID=110450 RepID=A0A6G1BRR1_9ORYZ|nr:hypothetical protein E2562_004257 [Oryza meyeriana var. granulata]
MHTQMRTSLLLLASLLLLLLATRAHGIRLDRKLQEAINKKEIMGDSKARQSSRTDRLMNKHCTSDGHCNSGKVQRPLVQAEAGAAAKQQQESSKRSDDAKQEQEATAAPRVPRQPEEKTSTTATTYPDILDIAGMDYSPATRKPPIHN